MEAESSVTGSIIDEIYSSDILRHEIQGENGVTPISIDDPLSSDIQ